MATLAPFFVASPPGAFGQYTSGFPLHPGLDGKLSAVMATAGGTTPVPN